MSHGRDPSGFICSVDKAGRHAGLAAVVDLAECDRRSAPHGDGYLVSRNLTLALLLLATLALRARRALGTLMVLTGFIQLFDAGLDVTEGRLAIAPGVLIFAIVFFLGAARLNGQPFWKVAAWRNVS